MKIRTIILTCLLLTVSCLTAGARKSKEEILEPSGTYLFAQRDTCSLYMDVYDPAEGSTPEIDGKAKPTILFMFGGGFFTGKRDDKSFFPWFRKLTENGYRVISIDYRLGMKGIKAKGMKFVKAQEKAIRMASEDLISATRFIIDNAEALQTDPYALVISGSSAGAITVLQTDWLLSNRKGGTDILPEDFRYAGVMSFVGAVFSTEGAIRYKRAPDPTLLFHGTEDKVVTYKNIRFLKYRFDGSSSLAAHFKKEGYNYRFYRFEGNSHEIAITMLRNLELELDFIGTNVMKAENKVVDTIVNDPSINNSKFKDWNMKKIYN